MSSPPSSSAAMNGEEPLAKNQEKNPSSPVLSKTLFSSLPNELVVSCFARVSRLHYPTLSLVSKRFPPLLTSSEWELYKFRSSLNRTESCLYVCLRFPQPQDPNPHPRWFTLCRRPNNNRNKSICNLLVPIPSSSFLPARWSSIVAVGSCIYDIGGTIEDEPSDRVLILDCKTHKWSEAPSMCMLMKRDHPTASVLDGKIYVAGGCKDIDSPNWMEVFDPKIGTWKPVSSPCAKQCDSEIIVSTEIDGKMYMHGYKGVAYNPKGGKCEAVDWNMCKGWAWFSHCVIDNVLYYFYDREFKCFDTSISEWRIMKGLKQLKIASYSHVVLADYGGKMAVLWDMNAGDKGKKIIRCAEIAIVIYDNGEVWGRVDLVDDVLEIPECYEFVRVLAATV